MAFSALSNSVSFINIKMGCGSLIAILLFLYFSSPGNVVVDARGNINGSINRARESIQREAFWKDQLTKVNSELQWELGAPQRQMELDQEMNQMMRAIDQSMEEIYLDYPEMRPSPTQQQAESLRERADEIEQQELDLYLENFRIERISELREILPIVKARTE